MGRKETAKKPTVDFDLRQLEIFCKVVELKSFSKAAKEVFLAQASVSERIATLETMIGARLLDRMGREVLPTALGKRLYELAIPLLEMKRSVCLEIEEFLGLKKGQIHMGGSTIPGEYILPRLIGAFHEKYPQIKVNIMVGDSTEIETRVVEGRLELGIIGYKSSNSNLQGFRLWEDELVVALPVHHPLSNKKILTPQELTKWPFISREAGSGTLKILRHHLKEKLGLDLGSFNVVATLGSSTAVKEAVKAGLGISILSIHAIKAEVNAGALKAVKIRGLPIRRSFYLIRDKRRIQSPLSKALTEFFLERSESGS